MLRQYRKTHRLVDDIRAARVNSGDDQRCGVCLVECSQVGTPVDDGG
jgi:hypothetical protein